METLPSVAPIVYEQPINTTLAYEPKPVGWRPNWITPFKENLKTTSNQLENATRHLSLDQKLNLMGNTVSGLMGAYNAYQANKLAKQQFAFSKDAWSKEYDAQKGLTNARLEDRQRRRFAESNGRAMSVSDYMGKYGVR